MQQCKLFAEVDQSENLGEGLNTQIIRSLYRIKHDK